MISTVYIFNFLKFKLAFLIGVQSSDLHNTKIPPIPLLLRQTGLCVCKSPSFSTNRYPEMRELYISCLKGGLVSLKWVQTAEYGLRKTLADFFIK
jgi:hypothetical protein